MSAGPQLTATLVATAAAGWTMAHRTAPAVRGWRPPSRPASATGPLGLSIGGARPSPVVVLLHGIVASGRSFGGHYDDLPGRVVVPDLLGFGTSMDVPTPGYSVDDHIDAVRTTLQQADDWDRPTVVVGHSMGGVLALHLAAAHPDPIGVLTVGAPLYDTAQEGLDRIGEADPLARFITVGDVAERLCSWMCDHREIAAAVWPMLGYRWPWPVAADGVLHTWSAYRDSLDGLVLDDTWRRAVRTLADRDVPVHLLDGAEDGVTVPGRAAAIADLHPAWTATTLPGADHALPLSHPDAVTDHIRRLIQTSTH